MLPFTEYGAGDTTLVLMPFLGGSQREWTEVVAILSKNHRCLTVDLPGFGKAADVPGYTVAEMVDQVVELLASLNLGRYLLVGHSMAAKVSAVAARRLIDDGSELHPPTALVLIAPSPPGPEPMSDSKRKEMLDTLSVPGEDDQKNAEKFIKANLTCVVPPKTLERTVADVLGMNRAAWTAWLESGSKEDWSKQVGMINLPTLIVVADDDAALGPDVQKKLTEPHFPRAHTIVVECNHLIPIEQPDEIAAVIANFMHVL